MNSTSPSRRAVRVGVGYGSGKMPKLVHATSWTAQGQVARRHFNSLKPSLYKTDLAYIHHAGFSFAPGAGPELLRILRARGIRSGTLVDLACGSGLWARAAQRAGFSVVGVDISRAMVRLARKISPRSSFVCASLHQFKLPPCDVVTILGEGLNYLTPGQPAPNLARLFQRIAAALRPGGVFIFDIITSGGAPMDLRLSREGADWAVLVDRKEYPRSRLLARKIVTLRRVRGRWRRSEETHCARLYDRREVVRDLRRAGFEVRASRRYGNYALLPRRMAFIACLADASATRH